MIFRGQSPPAGGADPDGLGSDPFSQKRALTPNAFAYVSGDITPRW